MENNIIIEEILEKLHEGPKVIELRNLKQNLFPDRHFDVPAKISVLLMKTLPFFKAK